MVPKPELIDKLVDVYRSFARCSFVVSGSFFKADPSTSTLKVQSKWTQRNLEKKDRTTYHKLHVINPGSHEQFTFPPVDVSSEQMSQFSQSENYSCVIREGASKDNGKKKQFLEIWNRNSMYRNFDVEEFDVHGSIYCDGEFGSLEWSPDDSKILYIAEKKLPKSVPFYKQKPKDPKDKPDETVRVGEEYTYKPDWGEQLVDKHQPVIGLCDIRSETLQVLQGIPDEFSPGQVIWNKSGECVYGIVLNNEPRRLGLIYCTNRNGYVFQLSLKGEFKILSDENKSVRSPRLSPDGKYLYWLQRSSGGPHNACQELIKYDLTSSKAEVIVPIVRKPGADFSGIYCHELPRRCFSNCGKKLFFSTANKTREMIYCINTETKELRPIEQPDGSSTVLDVYNDMILICSSTFQSTQSIRISKSLDIINWIPLTVSEEPLKNSIVKEMEFNLKDSKDSSTYFNAIFVGPSPETNKNVPLIVLPHGGPHSCVTNTFSIETAFFVTLGFATLYINYRGSTGAGEDGVEFLLGKISDSDVKDNQHAVDAVLKAFPNVDGQKIVAYGGSHGGFLVTQLSAQYPDTYKAVVARNPVIDVLSMYSGTDIPDWNMVESGYQFDGSIPLTLDKSDKMMRVSPIFQAAKIKAPTFLMVGKKDLRVPSNQGLSLYYLLKARNVKTRLNVYDDNHPLGQVPVHLDTSINAVLWFMEHLGMLPSDTC